ncbi:MAG: MBL fold metallo-hydrolase [Anaerolineae bacterium]|jgi:L-ascorbate metabolism protein UlaG (beta-lactamase superfamily)
MDAEELVSKLHWLGHDSFRLDGPPVIYFDPWKLRGQPPLADLVLVSHEHFDHCSPDDVNRIRGENTVLIASANAATELPGAQAVRPGDRVAIAGVEVEAVPAYNINKFRSPGVPYHPKEAEHVGYVVTVEGTKLYFAGDTDHIPTMAEIDCDVALLPVSGIYVMTAEEAREAAGDLQPQIAVPMHYGADIGTPEDGQRFADLYGGRVALLEQE